MRALPTSPTRIAELDALIAEADENGADHYDLKGRRDYHRYAAGENYFFQLRYEAGHDWTAEPSSQSPRYQQWIDGFEAEERLAKSRKDAA